MKLAIKGHSTRSKEVIELLEMLGGKNKFEDISFIKPYIFLFVDDDYYTEIGWEYIGDDNNYEEFIIYTLEEFLEKYPFKVGDFVSIPEYESEVRICKMRWDPTCQNVEYLVYRCDDEEWYTSDELLDYNDNTNKIIKDMEEKDKAMAPILVGEDYSGKRFGYKIPNGYEFDCIKNSEIIIKPIKPKYPKTYEECCKVLGCDRNLILGAMPMKYQVLINFQKLLICRDAYWKIAGEQMGLDKPWKPDWNDCAQHKFGLYTLENEIRCINLQVLKNIILVFPTEEMRDDFYNNFKDLIENCKELL